MTTPRPVTTPLRRLSAETLAECNRDLMNLPSGKTCGDCRHFKRTCEWLISCSAMNTRCDWNPSRFAEVQL